MVWFDDDDVYNALYHLCETKGSIGAVMDLADDNLAAALLEDRQRIGFVIDMLIEGIGKAKKAKSIQKVKNQVPQ